MITNILIAFGFFFLGGFVGTRMCVNQIRKIKKEGTDEHIIVYEL